MSAQHIDCGYLLEPTREAVPTSTHNLCFYQYYEKCQNFYLKTQFLVMKFSICLNRHVFVMLCGPNIHLLFGAASELTMRFRASKSN